MALSEPALLAGMELVGEFEDSGYREPPHLVCRPDGQVVRLPTLLYQVVRALSALPERQRTAAVAEELSRETGRQFTADHVAFLIDKKLAPLGITTYSDGSPPPPTPKSDPFLSFRFRVAVLPEHVTWFLSGLFAWLFRPLLVVGALAVFVAGEVWLWSTQDAGAALRTVLSSPAGVLLVVLLAIASCVFHEMGHGAACRYGGARPGAMGCGIYVVWPAFYTDITNSYRLGRAGRIRADLGGVYFNALFVLGLLALYAATGNPLLLVAILSVHLEMFQQLIPTLRFDGYYIVADLTGIPDLFKYIGPILKRVVLRRPHDERLRALKRWPQTVVAVWVVFLVPALVLQLGVVLMNMPRLLETDWRTVNSLVENAGTSGNQVLGMVAACIQILLLTLPVVGLVLVFARPVRSLGRVIRRRVSRRAPA
ncbi:putative peptide zinc metalloprotease protein YydH [Streptomyces netropsis]|nr:putative peptide zinc metalloprotease protein YydH [Streptomyces netropsis]